MRTSGKIMLAACLLLFSTKINGGISSSSSLLQTFSTNIDVSEFCGGRIEALKDEVISKVGKDPTLDQLLQFDYGKMMDAGAIGLRSQPSGILNGKLAWQGSKKECENIATMQYCNVTMDSKTLNKTVRIGTCLPTACSNRDVLVMVEDLSNRVFYNKNEFPEFNVINGSTQCTHEKVNECLADIKSMLPAYEEWSMPLTSLRHKMFDSWGKPQPNMAGKDFRWAGDSEQCMSLKSTAYCYVPIEVLGKFRGQLEICMPQSCKEHAPMVAQLYIDAHVEDEIRPIRKFPVKIRNGSDTWCL